MTLRVSDISSYRNRNRSAGHGARTGGLRGCIALASLLALVCSATAAELLVLTPSTMPRLGTVDERFQSYNIEMVEITGGRFWKPYRSKADSSAAPSAESNAPESIDASLFQYRPPIDLTNARLRMLAAALGPAYLRVSGTWANTTFFADSDQPPSAPPAGFKGILTRRQWRDVARFAKSADAEIMTSFAISKGTRDADGVWTPDQAQRLLRYTQAIGGKIAAAEFMNEPNLTDIGGAPAGYDAAAYGRDFKIFHSLMKRVSPQTIILGPGVASEDDKTADLLAASATGLDGYSYHYYGALSERCHGESTPQTALSEHWLSGTDRALAFHRALRDRLMPGKRIWLTETADAACGGNPWAVTFVDTFRYLDQLGRLARAGVKVVMHNTLAASDYGMLDEHTFAPRPKYWSALLWRRLMGTTVLDAGVPIAEGLHVYAHCQRDTPGGVALLVINNDRNGSRMLKLPVAATRYTLDASDLNDTDVRLNGHLLALAANGRLPPINGTPGAAGIGTFAPATITFLAIPAAANKACR
jgi:heparanase 1